MKQSLTIIIPSYNEEFNLKTYLPSVLDFCTENAFNLIVVNDGSKDDTERILDSFITYKCFKNIKLKVNCGYGKAIKKGIEYANSEFIITIDADGQHLLSDILKLYKQILDTNADMVIGSRKGFKDSSFLRTIGKNILRGVA